MNDFLKIETGGLHDYIEKAQREIKGKFKSIPGPHTGNDIEAWMDQMERADRNRRAFFCQPQA